MTNLKFMSDRRQSQLMKAAHDCLALINVKVDPNTALRKVAEDVGANDNEVVLISHAVNNASQLTHLQTAAPEDKDKPFPMTDASKVIGGSNNSELKPLSTEGKEDQPDGQELASNTVKEAADSLVVTQDYRKVAQVEDLRKLWQLDSIPTYAKTAKETELIEASKLWHQIDDAKMAAADLRDRADGLLGRAADELRKVAAPRWAEVEKAALLAGCDQAVLDLVYNGAKLASLREARYDASVKTAGVFVTSPAVVKLASLIAEAGVLLNEAADKHVEIDTLEGRLSACFRQSKVAGADGGNKDGGNKGGGGTSSFFTSDPLQFGGVSAGSFDKANDLTNSMLGGGSESAKGIAEMSSQLFTGGVAGDKPVQAKLDAGVDQQLKNIGAREMIERMMGDEYIKGHSIADVVDSYNRAISVNPMFGEAELRAYIRQDLSTQGATPLDLMIRASKSHMKGGDE